MAGTGNRMVNGTDALLLVKCVLMREIDYWQRKELKKLILFGGKFYEGKRRGCTK
jgi:hypothetical protein